MKPRNETSRPKLLAQLQHELKAVTRERLARRLAPSLMRMLGIRPHGIDLIVWISDEGQHSNADAVVAWISNELAHPEFRLEEFHTPELDLLAQRLARRLNLMEASYAC